MTARQDSVRQELAAAGTFVSAQDLHARLRAGGQRIGLTTVYRALAAMARDGEADVLTTDGQQVYRACGTGEHHHHLVCRSCGKTVEVSGPAVERWAQAVGREHGFADVTHTVEVFGTCTGCAAGAGGITEAGRITETASGTAPTTTARAAAPTQTAPGSAPMGTAPAR